MPLNIQEVSSTSDIATTNTTTNLDDGDEDPRLLSPAWCSSSSSSSSLSSSGEHTAVSVESTTGSDEDSRRSSTTSTSSTSTEDEEESWRNVYPRPDIGENVKRWITSLFSSFSVSNTLLPPGLAKRFTSALLAPTSDPSSAVASCRDLTVDPTAFHRSAGNGGVRAGSDDDDGSSTSSSHFLLPHRRTQPTNSGGHSGSKRSSGRGHQHHHRAVGSGGSGRRHHHHHPASMWTFAEGAMVPPMAAEDVGKLTVVLDLDETIVYARHPDGVVRPRPHVMNLMHFLKHRCEVIVWTAGIRSHAKKILSVIDPDATVIKHCVYRHHKWFHENFGTVYAKDIRRLNRPMETTVVIDNTAECCLRNPGNAIIVPDFLIDENNELNDENGDEDITLLVVIGILQDIFEVLSPRGAVRRRTEAEAEEQLSNVTMSSEECFLPVWEKWESTPVPGSSPAPADSLLDDIGRRGTHDASTTTPNTTAITANHRDATVHSVIAKHRDMLHWDSVDPDTGDVVSMHYLCVDRFVVAVPDDTTENGLPLAMEGDRRVGSSRRWMDTSHLVDILPTTAPPPADDATNTITSGQHLVDIIPTTAADVAAVTTAAVTTVTSSGNAGVRRLLGSGREVAMQDTLLLADPHATEHGGAAAVGTTNRSPSGRSRNSSKHQPYRQQ